MARQPADYREVLQRREFMTLAGAAGMAAMAGCSGNGNGDGTDSDGNGGGSDFHAEAQHVSQTGLSTADVQYNPYNPAGFSQVSHELLFDKFAYYNYASGEFMPLAVQEWNLDGETYVLKLREGMTWSNGDDVTAEDVRVQLELGLRMGSPYSDYVDSVETDGDHTVRLNLSGPVNPDILAFSILPNEWLQAPASVFSEYLENFESESEEAALGKLQEFTWSEPIASGPFELAEKGGDQLVTSHREDHPDADNINFGEYAFRFIGSNQSVYQSLMNNDIDSAFTIATPPRVVAQYPDAVEEVATPSLWGYGLVPNHDDKHTGDRAVRQAIAYVIDRKTVVENAGPLSKSPPKYAVGISNDNQERVLGERAGDFETYGQDERQTEKAAQVLEAAGYSKQGGTWTDENGDTVSLPVQVPSGWTDWITAAETAVDHLTQFGFDAEVDSRSFSTLLDTVWPNGNFKLASGGWNAGAPQGALPYFTLRHMLIENFRGHSYNYPAANQSRGGSNAEISVPEIGDFGGSDSLTVNPAQRISELAKTTDEDAANEIVIEQAWVTNVDLPMIPIAEKQEQSWLTKNTWDIPDDVDEAEAAQVHWPNAWLPRVGEMNYTGN